MGEPAREEPIPITPDMLAGSTRTGKIDFERGMRRLPPLVAVLIVANLAMFGWELAAGALADREAIIEAGALVRDRVLAGEWWRVVSAMFLHGGPDHVFGNVVVLYIVGMACEHAFGGARTALIYFTSGVLGAATSLAAGPGPSVGASGAIFGLIAAVIVVLYRHQQRFFIRDKRIGFVLAVWAAWQILTGFASPFVDNFAHLGGLAGGGMTALVLAPRLLAVPSTAPRTRLPA